MSLIEKIKIAFTTIKAVGNGIAEGKDIIAPKSQAEKRMDICKQCPFLGDFAGEPQCQRCGCLMNFKTKVAEATCPEGKW
jgi:hypothetical protein